MTDRTSHPSRRAIVRTAAIVGAFAAFLMLFQIGVQATGWQGHAVPWAEVAGAAALAFVSGALGGAAFALLLPRVRRRGWAGLLAGAVAAAPGAARLLLSTPPDDLTDIRWWGVAFLVATTALLGAGIAWWTGFAKRGA